MKKGQPMIYQPLHREPPERVDELRVLRKGKRFLSHYVLCVSLVAEIIDQMCSRHDIAGLLLNLT